MKRIITVGMLTATMVLATASVALAGEPTCAGANWGNHGDHIKNDYVHPGEPGGAEGGPAHFDHPLDVGPGASFCLEQAQAPSLSTPPGWA